MSITILMSIILTWTVMSYFVLCDIKREIKGLREELNKLNDKNSKHKFTYLS